MGKKLHPSGEGHQEYIDAVTGYLIIFSKSVFSLSVEAWMH